jgi:hypothetical protein
MNNTDIIYELMHKKIKNISHEYNLTYDDMKRICKNIDKSIFSDECVIWNGYITNNKKGHYINFYLNGKKIALHRILYCNYIDNLNHNEYIKFTCVNKGKCCNVNHLKKIVYSLTDKNSDINNDNLIINDLIEDETNNKTNNETNNKTNKNIENKKNVFLIEF